jgi:[acyl-carrier-protein] S-malonyltransferase
MAQAAAVRPTTMAAVLGGTVDEDDLAAAGLEVATINVPGQVVVGGPVEALQAWTPPSGARVRPLDVAGAFHTSAMAPAVDGFRALVEQVDASDADCDVVANGDGAALRDGRELLTRLVGQLTRPVRFDLCLTALAGTTEAYELAPAGVLTGMAKRAGIPVTAVKTPCRPRGARMTERRDPRTRLTPPGAPRGQHRRRRTHRLLRRVDPRAQRHRHARRRRDDESVVEMAVSGRRQGARRRPASPPRTSTSSSSPPAR